jgi:hypothetical protein
MIELQEAINTGTLVKWFEAHAATPAVLMRQYANLLAAVAKEFPGIAEVAIGAELGQYHGVTGYMFFYTFENGNFNLFAQLNADSKIESIERVSGEHRQTPGMGASH